MMGHAPEKGKSTSQDATQATGTNGEINPFEVMRRILCSDLTPGAVRLLLMIADKAGHGRGQCWASVETLARLIHMSPGQARRILEALENGGWIVSVRSGKTKFSRKIITLGPRSLSGPTGDSAPTRQREAKSDSTPTRQRAPQASRQRAATLAPARSQLSAGAHQTSSLTNPITSSSTSEAKSDDDDVRSAPSEEKTPEGTIEDVCDVIKRCKHLPNDLQAKIREEATLGHRIKGDWMTLALAALRLDQKIRDRDAPPARKILKPLAYLLEVFQEITGPDFPPGERDGLAAKVERLRDDRQPEAPSPGYAVDGTSELDYRAEVRGWIYTAVAKDRSVPEIKPAILAHIDKIGAERSYSPAAIEIRKLWASREIDGWLADRSSKPMAGHEAPARKAVQS